MSFRVLVASPQPYLAWLALSALGLLTCERIDPYVFAAAAFLGAGVSAVLILLSLFGGPRVLALALVAGLPTGAAFWWLSTYRWA